MKEIELKRIPFDRDNVAYDYPVRHISSLQLERFYSKAEVLEIIKKYYNQGHTDAARGMVRFGVYFVEMFKDKDIF